MSDKDIRTLLIIATSTFLAGIIRQQWAAYKKRKAQEPTPLKLRGGVWVPWGPVEKVQHFGNIAFWIWFILLLITIGALIGKKLL